MATAYQQNVEIRTRGRGTTEITAEVARFVGASGIATGVAHVFVQHTSCSVMIIENADPAARDASMAAQARGAPAASSVTVPVGNGELLLGTRQGIYLWEHRTAARSRRIVVTVTG